MKRGLSIKDMKPFTKAKIKLPKAVKTSLVGWNQELGMRPLKIFENSCILTVSTIDTEETKYNVDDYRIPKLSVLAHLGRLKR